MMRRSVIIFAAILSFLLTSCKKNSTSKDNPPLVLNAQESKLTGTWTQDSVRLYGTATPTTSTYISGLRYIFKAEIYCPNCSSPTAAFKGMQETVPNSFSDFVWSAKKQDTLMIGANYSTMSPEKTYTLTSNKLILIYKGSLNDSCVAYFHK